MLLLFFLPLAAYAVVYLQFNDSTVATDTIVSGSVSYFYFNVSNAGFGDFVETKAYLSGVICSVSGDPSSINDLKVYTEFDLYVNTSLRSSTFTNGLYVYLAYNKSNQHNHTLYVAIEAPHTFPSTTWTYMFSALLQYVLYQYNDPHFVSVVDADHELVLLELGSLVLDNDTVYDQPTSDSGYELLIFTEDQFDVLQGFERLLCAIANAKSLNPDVTVLYTKRGGGSRLQYYVTGLDSDTTYTAVVVLYSDNTDVDKGGVVYSPFNFTTESDDNCKLVYNLTLCLDVAYRIPVLEGYLDGTLNVTELAMEYDETVWPHWLSFTYALQQTACFTERDAAYLPFVTCDDCAAAYKSWLCATMIPQCSSVGYSGYISRAANYTNLFNGVNALVAYYEVPPCIDMCQSMVAACPTDTFGFACPEGSNITLAYGIMLNLLYTSCNYILSNSSEDLGWNNKSSWAHAADVL